MIRQAIPVEVESLLPCPFCGGKAKTFGPYGWNRQWGISHSCPTFYNGAQELCQGFNSEASAISAWNTRTSNTHDELVSALEGLLAHPGTHHDRCIHWETVGCDCEYGEVSSAARAVLAKAKSGGVA